MTYIVMTSSAHLPSPCWGKYRNVAIVKLTDDYAQEGRVPRMISKRAKGVKAIVFFWGPLDLDTTTFQSQLAAAQKMAARWNADENRKAAA